MYTIYIYIYITYILYIYIYEKYTYIYIRTYAHTHIHTYIRTHTHTYIHLEDGMAQVGRAIERRQEHIKNNLKVIPLADDNRVGKASVHAAQHPRIHHVAAATRACYY